jgi:hypothetical protein
MATCLTVDDMPQRNSHREFIAAIRPPTVEMLPFAGLLLISLVLVLLITNGGAG